MLAASGTSTQFCDVGEVPKANLAPWRYGATIAAVDPLLEVQVRSGGVAGVARPCRAGAPWSTLWPTLTDTADRCA